MNSKTLYLDVFSGISGDMFIGALLDLGVSFEALQAELQKVDIGSFHLHQQRQTKTGIAGIKFDVHEHHAHGHSGHDHDHHHPHDHSHGPGDHGHTHQHEPAHHHHHGDSRNYADIRKLILGSALSDWVKEKSVAVFHRIAVAEGKIHGHPPEEVHFHEVGAIDSIVDVIGACVCLEQLGRPRVLAAQVTEGTGWVNCAHGRFPVPTLATLEILGTRGIAVNQCDEPHELVTPTGAAILAEFAETFGPMHGVVAERVGYGLGTRDNHTRPNVLRAVLGPSQTSPAPAPHLDWETDTIAVLETNLDDVNPELLGAFVEQALKAGALDVFHTPIQMKKSRPAILLTVLCPETKAEALSELMLRETTAFGVRRTAATRRKLQREIVKVSTAHGPVQVKLGRLNGKLIQAAPEFESCRALAEQKGISLKEVYSAAQAAARGGD
jgi:pyridinium-3,5-bisthiocarboxylic acid mononucleotide nickel chelatase